MRRFVNLFFRLDSVTSTNQKVATLKDYFSKEPPREAVLALHLLLGKRRKRVVTSRKLREVYTSLQTLPDWLFESCRNHVGDTAETISLLLRSTGNLGDEEVDSAMKKRSLEDWMSAIQQLSYSEDKELNKTIKNWWMQLPYEYVFILNKIMTGGFRVGVSQKLVIRSLSQALQISEASLHHRLMGWDNPTPEFFKNLTDMSEEQEDKARPYPFFLASPSTTDNLKDKELKNYLLEYKWDGIRSQVIFRNHEVFIWSRGEELITGKYPELPTEIQSLPSHCVLDGEIVAWENGPLNFSRLQKRIGRKNISQNILKEVPVRFIAFDLLELSGKDLRSYPLKKRRSELEKVFKDFEFESLQLSPALDFSSWQAIEEARSRAKEDRIEGYMAKRKDSVYDVGRRKGSWWKLKAAPFTLDAVLIYAQAGSGKRANLFTDYTFALWSEGKLIPFAKAYSGLNQKEIEELDRWIRQNTQEKFGPVRSVKAEHVFEIAFEGVSQSNRHKSGIAVRFPRILRWRSDLSADDADSLEQAHELLKEFSDEVSS